MDNMEKISILNRLRTTIAALNGVLQEAHGITSNIEFDVDVHWETLLGRSYDVPIVSITVYDKEEIGGF